MKIYNGGRRNGKTAKLIRYAAKYGHTILVRDKQAAEYIENTARKMGAWITHPITLDDLKHSNLNTRFIRGVVIDNAEQVLQEMLFDYTDGRGTIKCLTITTEEHFVASVNDKGDIVIKRIDSEEGGEND